MNFKKAQSNVSGLMMLILFLIVLYSLMMPPCDKCSLLGTECPDYCQISSENVLLSENLGYITSSNIIVRELDSVNLFMHTGPESTNLVDFLSISKGWFGGINQELSFNIEGSNDLDLLSISFLVTEASGKLSVYLNDLQIFSDELFPGQKSINLPLEYIEEMNKLKFYVNYPGILFWKKNQYILEDMKLEKFYEIVYTSSDLKFITTEEEVELIDHSFLDYSFYCNYLEGFSSMKIYLNDNFIFSEDLNCTGGERNLPLGNAYVQSGENVLKFLIDNGEFLISNVRLTTSLQESISPTYNFQTVNNFDKNFKFLLSFGVSNFIKKADIFINGKLLDLNTYENTIEFDITELVEEGINTLEIIPDSNFTVNLLKIWYE